jgi:hypothetical protein
MRGGSWQSIVGKGYGFFFKKIIMLLNFIENIIPGE